MSLKLLCNSVRPELVEGRSIFNSYDSCFDVLSRPFILRQSSGRTAKLEGVVLSELEGFTTKDRSRDLWNSIQGGGMEEPR